MDNRTSTYSPAFSIVSWIALFGGIVTYLLGLWNADIQLNEKGYYFDVLVLGLFSAASYQKTVRDKYEGIPTTPIYYVTCLAAFVIAVALLVVGLWNATLLLSEKGFYGLAFFLSLFGAVAVQKNIRDGGFERSKETVAIAEEFTE
ncbi:YiaB family inner membrane protein [Citrobacter sp. FDAARGOS_156]|uniref:inner membrane protein YiaA n=1 Tax=Citrobacter sp. FDAARGOS_156 TaxID=1702170 RepID=UPI001902B26C|nr:inner membrane protein YiaA [Citrobacter sp. FDAARGOS_156]MBJ8741737.1 YiaB family inner membrane protein [Citrobacter sp. FDAARGOS_156]